MLSAFVFAILIVNSSIFFYSLSCSGAREKYSYPFNDYVKKFNKSYSPGTPEYDKRKAVFQESLKRIEELNKHRNFPNSALFGITQFSDLTPTEFRQHVIKNKFNISNQLKYQSQKHADNKEYLKKTLPKRFDWREKNVVTPVKNQYQCGACWAFSIVETIETMYGLKNGELEQWSVQQMIDCASKPNQGCDGGDTCLAIQWLYENKINLVMNRDYPFADDTGLCKIKKSEKTVQVAANFTCDRFVGDEETMLQLLAFHGPLIAAVDATRWQDYIGGIIQFNCEANRNHAVQIVGYDLTGDIPYYIVRNTWGTEFGINGYLYIAVGHNLCAIAEEVSSLDVI